MKILAIGAHFDDVELGCGGTLLRWKNEGHELHVLTVTTSGYKDARGNVIRSDEAARAEGEKAAKLMGATLHAGRLPALDFDLGDRLQSQLLAVADEVKPDVILTHWENDAHRDHRYIGTSSRHCFRNHPRLLFYRSNWYHGSELFHENFYVDISSTFEQKLNLLEVFETEYRRAGEKWRTWASAQAELAGLQAKCRRAEGFQVVRWTW